MRSVIVSACLLAGVASGPALAADCPGNPRAIGTSRTIVVDPSEHPRLGGHQYRETLPLADREVVLTFDDGPLPPHTNRVLDVLRRECVQATFFLVGQMVRAFPQIVRRIHDEGHTLASHSQNHPYTFHVMSHVEAAQEIEAGFNSIAAAVGDRSKVAPFFRFPGLQRQDAIERYLGSRGIQTWSVDAVADDWTPIESEEIVRRAISRLEANGRGILLLHDIKPLTAAGLQYLLHQLKARGFRIVHVVPASAARPKTVTTAEQWLVRNPPSEAQLAQQTRSVWPRVVSYKVRQAKLRLEAPSPANFGAGTPDAFVPVDLVPAATTVKGDSNRKIQLASITWPDQVIIATPPEAEILPVPAADNFRYTTKKRVRVKRPPPARVAPAAPPAAPRPETRSFFSMLFGGSALQPKAAQPKAKSPAKAAPEQRSKGQVEPVPRPTASLTPRR